jgi:hypothetical protein
VSGTRALVLAAGAFLFVIVALEPGGLAGNYRKTWAAGATLLGLSLLADLWPDGAGPLAVLVALAAAYRSHNLGNLFSGRLAQGGAQAPPGIKGPQTTTIPKGTPVPTGPGGPAGTTGPVVPAK